VESSLTKQAPVTRPLGALPDGKLMSMRPWVSDEASSGERCLTALCGVSHSESHRHGDSPRILGTRSRVARPPVGLQRTHAACSRMPGSSRSAQEVSPGLSQSGARQARAVIPPAHLVTPHITSRMRRIGILATPSALRLREIASDPRYSIGISPGLIQNEDDIERGTRAGSGGNLLSVRHGFGAARSSRCRTSS